MRLLILIMFFIPVIGKSQLTSQPLWGAGTGIAIRLGTHTNSIGIHINAFFSNFHCQFNIGEQMEFVLNDIGNRKKYFQSRTSLGMVLLMGERTIIPEIQLNSLYHNTNYSYGLAYNYLWYLDQKGTSQRSGGLAMHIKQFSILFENDFFSGQGRDRFRTGHLALTFRDSLWKFTSGFSIWTGETSGTYWDKTSFYGCPNGYRSLEDQPFGKTSHGVAYLGIDYYYYHRQSIGYRCGIDSEQLRHFLQNRILHDMIWFPKGLKRNTPHYPMMDENGCPVFNKTEARRTMLYFQGGVNTNWSY